MQSDFIVDVETIDFSAYDIVISINVCVPTKIVKNHVNTLFCYMMGEAEWSSTEPDFGYDVFLNQKITGRVAQGMGEIDFPYTFLGPNTLENLQVPISVELSGRNHIYAEVNCVSERPVKKVPQLETFSQKDREILVHHQNIQRNLERLRQSKYFIKLGGRVIRGNSVIEAISAGCVALINPKEMIYSSLIPSEVWFENDEQLKRILGRLDRDHDFFAHVLKYQKSYINQNVFLAPMLSLLNALDDKRKNGPRKKFNFVSRMKKTLKGWLSY